MHNLPVLKIKRHLNDVTLPQKAHQTDSGIDLSVYKFDLKNDQVVLFNTGISVELSAGYYVEVFPRSSIIKSDFVMANSVGIIDSDYRGIIFVPFRYVGKGDITEASEKLVGTRIAQMIVRERIDVVIEEVIDLSDTGRGAGGFGSSGK